MKQSDNPEEFSRLLERINEIERKIRELRSEERAWEEQERLIAGLIDDREKEIDMMKKLFRNIRRSDDFG